MMDSISLSLMILTFFVPLVFYFITSVEDESEVVETAKVDCSVGARAVRVTSSYHPVLKSNVASARLMALEH
jgi:ABC-type glycerol-3-phosphate transport system permease component